MRSASKLMLMQTFGEPESETYKAAVDAFTRSLAAYSVICYILQLKDRHNGNVLIDNQGRKLHASFNMFSHTLKDLKISSTLTLVSCCQIHLAR